MIYAIRKMGSRETLVEFPSEKALRPLTRVEGRQYMRVNSAGARQWVKSGGEHETGLWVEGGKVRYASREV